MLLPDLQRRIILSYVQAYNKQDVTDMLQQLHPEVIFEDRNQQETTLRIEGIEAFEHQARRALEYFSEREQTILRWISQTDSMTIEIAFTAIPATDFPNGWVKGIPIHMQGTSTFRFKDQKIIEIIDQH